MGPYTKERTMYHTVQRKWMHTGTFVSLFIVCSLMLSLLSCGTRGPTHDQLTKADYGESPSNPEDIISDFMKKTLSDPENLKNITVDKPKKGWTYTKEGKAILFGYCSGVSFRTESSDGKDVRLIQYIVFIRNGKVVDFIPRQDAVFFFHITEK